MATRLTIWRVSASITLLALVACGSSGSGASSKPTPPAQDVVVDHCIFDEYKAQVDVDGSISNRAKTAQHYRFTIGVRNGSGDPVGTSPPVDVTVEPDATKEWSTIAPVPSRPGFWTCKVAGLTRGVPT